MSNNKVKLLVASMGATLLISGCANLAPDVGEAKPNIPSSWEDGSGEKNNIGNINQWRQVIKNENLIRVIEGTLANNRDLKARLIEVDKIKKQYDIAEANRSFDIDGSASTTKGENGNRGKIEESKISVKAGYEIDIFNKAKNMSNSAWQEYMSKEFDFDQAKSEIISAVTQTYIDYLAEEKWLDLSTQTLETRIESYNLSKKKNELGLVSDLTLAKKEGLVEAARREVAKHKNSLKKNYQALNVFVGGNIDDYELEGEWGDILRNYISIARNLSSDVLLNRPDIKSMEAKLLAANANIGVARASRFPSIRITGEAGTISTEFSDLMSSGTGMWGITPSINVPIFNAGRLKKEVEIAELEKERLINKYESSIQKGFQEVANIITDYEMLSSQKEAIDREVKAANKAYDISKIRYDAGRDDYISFLDSERTLYNAQKEKIAIELAQQKVLISLYKGIGGVAKHQ